MRLLDVNHQLWSSFKAENVWSRPFVNNSSWPRSEAVLWLTVSAGGGSETPGWTEGASHQSHLILSLSSQQIIIQELTSAQLGNLVNYLAGRCCLWRHYSAQMRAMINRSQGSLTFPCEVDSLKWDFFSCDGLIFRQIMLHGWCSFINFKLGTLEEFTPSTKCGYSFVNSQNDALFIPQQSKDACFVTVRLNYNRTQQLAVKLA